MRDGMFGYVTANKPEMKMREFARYKGFYCGLCRSLKTNHGRRGQITLTYDMTFLVILLSSLYEPKTDERKKRCIIHPGKKQYMLINEISDYAADMNILLTYDHLADDWNDEKKLSGYVGMKVFAGKKKKIEKKYPRQAEAVELAMKELKACEKNKERNVDVVAGTTGNMLGAIFAWKEDHWQEELYTLGFYLGKFIYLMDAYEDRKRDEKAGRYNPLIDAERENRGDYETLCRLMLTSMMSECAKCFERLPILLHGEILRNVIYSGVWTKYEYLQCKNKKSEEKKSKKEKEER